MASPLISAPNTLRRGDACPGGAQIEADDLPRGNALTVAPNPARGRARIQYEVARGGRVRVELLDVSGRVVATLADRLHEPGHHEASWDALARSPQPAPGLYLVRVSAPDGVAVRKVAVIE